MLKRFIDCALAATALLFVGPLGLLVALLVRATMGQPVLFRQARIGYREAPFFLYKFRTMREATGPDGKPLPDSERITPFGRFLRRTSLDELPQLWNVLRGEMSLVGPRPLLPQYLERYTPEQRRRHAARPGITGWAQVNGRNALSWEARFELDCWYVDHRSVGLDAKILLMTVGKVLRGEGIAQNGEATMSEFLGSEFPGSAVSNNADLSASHRHKTRRAA